MQDWDFYQQATEDNFRLWYWRQDGEGGARVSSGFRFYYDCVRNAYMNGYSGPLRGTVKTAPAAS
jgi:hypothetical protein